MGVAKQQHERQRPHPRRALAALFALAALACAVVAGCGTPRSPTMLDRAPDLTLDLRAYALPNGLRVVLHPDRSVPYVYVSVVYDVGSADDPPGAEGMAHFVEHLTFDGSEHLAPYEHFVRVEAVGGVHANAETSMDTTAYHEVVPSGALDTALWLESERMISRLDRVAPAELERERAVVLQEVGKGKRRDLFEQVMAEVFPPEHPYHHAGRHAGVPAIKLEGARAFADAHYAPNTATLVVAGDFDPKTIGAMIDRRFGDLPRRATAARASADDARPFAPDPSRKPLEMDEVGPDRIILAWPAPPAGTEAIPALRVATRVLQAMAHQAAVPRARVVLDEERLGSVVFAELPLAKNVAHAGLLRHLDDALEQMTGALGAIDGAHFAWARTTVGAHAYFDFDALDERGATLGRAMSVLGDPRAPERQLRETVAASADDVRSAVAWFLRPDRRVVAFVHGSAPQPGAR